MTTWILVANRTQARVYRPKLRALELVRKVDHPEGRISDQDREGGEAVRSFDRHAAGRGAADRGNSPHELSAHDFARQLAEILEQGRLTQEVSRIVLVAEPRMLGILRSHLDPPTAALVVGSVAKDLHAIPDHEVVAHLDPLLLASGLEA